MPGRDVSVRARRLAVDVLWIVVGLGVLLAGGAIARDGTVPAWERRAFRAVNDLPDALHPVVWPVQQLGALFVVPLVALVLFALRRRRLALAVLVCGAAKLVTERVVKAAVSRQRPGTSIGLDIEARGDVSLQGESFVSGHAILIAAIAGVLSPHLVGPWLVVCWILVGAVMVGRVYVGAHNPLDVICGAALGVAIAGAVNLVTGARRQARQ